MLASAGCGATYAEGAARARTPADRDRWAGGVGGIVARLSAIGLLFLFAAVIGAASAYDRGMKKPPICRSTETDIPGHLLHLAELREMSPHLKPPLMRFFMTTKDKMLLVAIMNDRNAPKSKHDIDNLGSFLLKYWEPHLCESPSLW
jgi:hypothetical protein